MLIDVTRNQCSFSTRKPPALSVLIVDDDEPLTQCLAQAMETRGFNVTIARSVLNGCAQIQLSPPAYAVVDMRLDDGCGLDIISALKQQRPDARAIILTGYGNIATAVSAVKLGAVDYLVNLRTRTTSYLLCSRRRVARPSHQSTPCRRIACAGSISSTSMKRTAATCRRLRAVSACSGAPYSGFFPNVHCMMLSASNLVRRSGPARPRLFFQPAIPDQACDSLH